MELQIVDQEVYQRIIPNSFHLFNQTSFNVLNQDKVKSLYFLLFKDSKYRLGLIAGTRDGRLRSPFSAPFGGFSFLRESVSLEQMDQALSLLQEWAVAQELSTIEITLPPVLYQPGYLSKWVNVFYRAGYETSRTDLNYAFFLEDFDADYPSRIRRNARKNLKASLRHDFVFHYCENMEEKRRAYDVIKENRQSKGYPLRMSWEQVQGTVALVPADFFLLQYEGEDIAAALVYEVRSDIVQVIYWGEIASYGHLRPMNYLSYTLFEYYKKQGRAVVDIGPSTDDSIPNHGLCEFKESIGCRVDLKMSFKLSLQA